MEVLTGPVPKRRNENYRGTHTILIERAAELIAKSGADGVSITSVARSAGIDRATVYYHFKSREVLMVEALEWSAERTKADKEVSRWNSVNEITNLFKNSRVAVLAWVDDYLSDGVVRERYPQWDNLVAQIGNAFAALELGDAKDAEVYSALLLAGLAIFPDSQLKGVDLTPPPQLHSQPNIRKSKRRKGE